MTQPTALYLADVLEHKAIHEHGTTLELACAAELRRLHSQRDALLEALKSIERSTYDAETAALARVDVAKVEGLVAKAEEKV